MSKIVLPPVTGNNNTSRINQNFQEIAEALNDQVLYRDNPVGEPNEMITDLDMNGKRLYNLARPYLDHEAARLQDVREQGGAPFSYFGPLPADPTTRPDGSPLVPGDSYYNTTSNTVLYWNGSAWFTPNIDGQTLALPDGSSRVGFIQEGANAIGRTVQDKAREVLSIADYTSINDSNINASAVFTALEADHKGKHVDLLGRTFLVAAIPTENDYYNGVFRVGSSYYEREMHKRSSPFNSPTPDIRDVIPRAGIYRGLNVGFVPVENSSKWVTFWRQSSGHGVEDGTTIMAANTDDTMNTLTDTRIIYRTSSADSRNFSSGRMGSGRIGICIARPQEAGTYLNPVFLYNDDNNVGSWIAVNMPSTGNRDFHGDIYPWPASAGGHDTMGYKTFAYRPSAEGGGIVGYSTVDNGLTWVEQVGAVLPNGTFPNLSEMCVARVRNENKWIMFIRTSSGSNAAIATSTDMTTWTGAVDSGLLLKGNPPACFTGDGLIWFLSFSRRGQELLPEFGNAIVISQANPDTLFNSGGSSGLSPWKLLKACKFWPTGYINVQKVRGRYYGFFTSSEEQAGNSRGRTSYLSLLNGDGVQSANTGDVLSAIPGKNYVWNGSFTDWRAGTSFTTFTQRTPVASGFTFARTGFATGASVSRVNGDESRFAMQVGRVDGDTSTSALNLTHTFTMDNSIPFRNKVVTLSFRVAAGSGFSAASGFLGVQLRQTNNAGEQTITSASGLFSIGDAPVDTSGSGANIDTLWRDKEIVLQNVAEDTTQLSLRITYTPVGTALNDYFRIEKLKMEMGRGATPFIQQDVETVNTYASRFYQSKTVQTENGSRHIPLLPMHKTPAVTSSLGSVSAITQDGFELTHTAVGAASIVATAWL